jgi:beta-glucosidase/6-phospho-beta-glucosidase/beta-galactosidase
MGDVDNGNLPIQVALNDHKRVEYLQRHIATLKESMEYESIELTSISFFSFISYIETCPLISTHFVALYIYTCTLFICGARFN